MNPPSSGRRIGFFYRFLYFLLPDEQRSAAEFLNALRCKPLPVEVEVIKLLEEPEEPLPGSYERGVSIAPYFIIDALCPPETIQIEDVNDIFPTEVELLTQREYNRRLRALIAAHCPGCGGFGGLTDSDSSLSGHFSEISLDGVCLCRWETAPEESFLERLDAFSEAWQGLPKSSAPEMARRMKRLLGLSFSEAECTDEGLLLHVKKPDFFSTVLTQTVANRVLAHLDEDYALELEEQVSVTQESVDALLSEKKRPATRRSMRKYGVAFAEISFSPDCEPIIAPVINALIFANALCPLYSTPGRLVCLLLGETSVMMFLRFSSPVLSPCDTRIVVTNAQKTAAYQINFDMPCELLETAALPEQS